MLATVEVLLAANMLAERDPRVTKPLLSVAANVRADGWVGIPGDQGSKGAMEPVCLFLTATASAVRKDPAVLELKVPGRPRASLGVTITAAARRVASEVTKNKFPSACSAPYNARRDNCSAPDFYALLLAAARAVIYLDYAAQATPTLKAILRSTAEGDEMVESCTDALVTSTGLSALNATSAAHLVNLDCHDVLDQGTLGLMRSTLKSASFAPTLLSTTDQRLWLFDIEVAARAAVRLSLLEEAARYRRYLRDKAGTTYPLFLDYRTNSYGSSSLLTAASIVSAGRSGSPDQL